MGKAGRRENSPAYEEGEYEWSRREDGGKE